MKKLEIGSLKGVTEAVCGLKPADLSNDTIKTLIHFSHNKKVQIANQFYHYNNNNNNNKKYSKLIVCGTHIHLPFRGEL